MVPTAGAGGRLLGLSRGGVPVATQTRVVKGVEYAVFAAAAGDYTATYPAVAVPAPAPAKPRARDRKAPRIKVRPRRVRSDRRGRVRLRLPCPRGESMCRVHLKLRRRGGMAGQVKTRVRGGKTRSVKVKLRKPTRRKLRRARALRTTAYAAARDRAGNRAQTKTRIRVLAPRRRR